MREFFNKPTTRAFIDTVVFFLAIIGVPALYVQIMLWANIDPLFGLGGSLISTALFIGMMVVYNNRLEKRRADQASTESEEDQPLNS